MFIGHYSFSFALKAKDKTIPLWFLFLAVQLMDVFWAIFVLLGIEKVRIVPGITTTNPLDLYYMPFTHSLPGSLFWSLLLLTIYWLFKFKSVVGAWKSGVLVGIAVFSHWVLDVIVHRPDMPLYDNSAKIGLGLWNYPAPAFILEALLLFAGIWIYQRRTMAVTKTGKYGFVCFGLFMVAYQATAFFGPPPPGVPAAAIVTLFSYALMCFLALWLERKRN